MAESEGNKPASSTPHADRHLWEYRWFRDAAILVVVALLILLVWWTRAILLPVVLGLALAYMANPLITYLQQRARLPRWLSTFGLLMVGLIALSGAVLYLLPRLLGQAYSLVQRVPTYVQTLTQKLQNLLQYSVSLEEPAAQTSPTTAPVATIAPDAAAGAMTPDAATVTLPNEAPTHVTIAPDAATVRLSPDATSVALPSDIAVTMTPDQAALLDPATTSAPAAHGNPLLFGPDGLLHSLAQMDLSQLGATVLKWLGFGVGVVSSAVSIGAYLILAVAITLICFFYFSWKFDGIIAWFAQFVPGQNRTRTLHILSRMDKAIAAWFRGRLLQAMLLGSILSVGWGFAGVPYWLLLGILGGMLNLIPYMSGLTLPVVILMILLDAFAQGSPITWWAILLWPAVVFAFGQLFDGWVVEPLVQGQATSLDPLSVLIAVLIGGSLAGVLGMILAIPTAACVKILWQEVIQARVREILNGSPTAG